MNYFTEIRPHEFMPIGDSPMARRSTAQPSTTVAELERQLEADTEITTLPWEPEALPDFPPPAEVEQRESSANGTAGTYTADPDGFNVRPSQQCRTPSPLGIGCTLRVEHRGRHSWGPTQEEAPDLIEAAPGQPIEQTELPGTPEPEQNEYSAPLESAFAGKDVMAAAGLKTIGERLISGDESLAHLVGVEVRYFWRRRGGTQGGNPRYGRIKRPGMYEAYFTGGKVVYLLDLSADHVREAHFTDTQIEACVYSQLVKTDVDPDDHDAYRLVGVDFSGTVRELERFGAWSPDLREMHAHVAKLPLEEAIEAAGGDEADEGQESA